MNKTHGNLRHEWGIVEDRRGDRRLRVAARPGPLAAIRAGRPHARPPRARPLDSPPAEHASRRNNAARPETSWADPSDSLVQPMPCCVLESSASARESVVLCTEPVRFTKINAQFYGAGVDGHGPRILVKLPQVSGHAGRHGKSSRDEARGTGFAKLGKVHSKYQPDRTAIKDRSSASRSRRSAQWSLFTLFCIKGGFPTPNMVL
jgi:hypothetical protein